jgi:DNA-binding Lrp family transcriptional regulator
MHCIQCHERANVRIMHNPDATDLRLIASLSDDPRSTAVALADRLGMSRNTVQARLAALERSGIFLPFDRRVDPALLGYPLAAFISVHVQQRKLASIVSQLAQIPEIVQAHGLSGPSDLVVRVVCVDTDDLFRINGAILACDGVERTETSLDMGELIPFRVRPLLDRGTRALS